MRMRDQVPLVLRLFARFIPGDLREPIAGDLHEEYLAMRERRGAARADGWLWWQSLRLALTFRWERAAHGRPLPPIGDELRGFGSMWDGLRQDIAFGARMLRRQPGFTDSARCNTPTRKLPAGFASAIHRGYQFRCVASLINRGRFACTGFNCPNSGFVTSVDARF